MSYEAQNRPGDKIKLFHNIWDFKAFGYDSFCVEPRLIEEFELPIQL